MKIAQIAPLVERVPPKKYGGTERVIHALTEELVGRGHEVTLFASSDSQTSASLYGTYPKGLREVYPEPNTIRNLIGLQHASIAYSMQDEFDVIHDHTGWMGVRHAQYSRKPVVMTLHGAIHKETERFFSMIPSLCLVAISRSQTFEAPQLTFSGAIYNGLPMSHYPFEKRDKGYLLYVGRFSKEKGPHIAVRAAKLLGMPLIMAAKLEGSEGKRYFEKEIKPHLSSTIQWVGEVSEKERNELFANALCSLHPVSWPEPFGLTLIEAMACGCPVVAFGKGSIPEVVDNGKTGFVVETLDEMIAAIKRIDLIDRKYCREYALERFSDEKMTDGYERVYRELLASRYFPERLEFTPLMSQ